MSEANISYVIESHMPSSYVKNLFEFSQKLSGASRIFCRCFSATLADASYLTCVIFRFIRKTVTQSCDQWQETVACARALIDN